jgi:putative transposase
LQLSAFSRQGSTGSANTAIRSRKIRIYPTAENKAAFRRWLGAARFAFNATVEYLNKLDGKRPTKYEVAELIKSQLPKWVDDQPYQAVRNAILEACSSYSACKLKSKQTKMFNKLGFRSRKNPEQSVYIPKQAVLEKGIFYTISGVGLRLSEKLPKDIRDCRLMLSSGRWYLIVPHEVQLNHTENQGRVVALDPGVRKFITYYSEDSYGELGSGDFSQIFRLLRSGDKLLSRAATSASRHQRKRLRRAAERVRYRVRNLVSEIHHKAARFLVDHFDVILLPTFEVQQMTARNARKIRSKTVRSMLTWRHFGFKQFLKWKAREAGKVVIDVNEAYTSKTCSWSGEIISNLGGRKVIRGSDGISMDRDANGARGILLRALVDKPWQTSKSACIPGGDGR